MFGGKWNSGFNTDNLALEAGEEMWKSICEDKAEGNKLPS